MKTFKILFIFLSMTLVASAYSHNIRVTNYYHPKSEPKGLYIVDFTYNQSYFTYRVYCPTGEVREITGGSWGTSRKAYAEDRKYFRGARVVREAFDEVCE